MVDYINTNTFRDFADFVIWPSNNRPFVANILKQNAIIYCKTDFVPYLFNNLAFAGRKYILITHASDYSIDAKIFNSRPTCIKKWYAENAKYVHPDLITLPIGLTPNKDVDKTGLDLDWFISNLGRLSMNTKLINKVYCNWSISTNPKKRSNILDKLKANGIQYMGDFPEFPANLGELLEEQKKANNWQKFNELLHYYDYCENMSKHKFVICPEGNGDCDTHRVWEALYMDCIPIVIKNTIYRDYENDLPIIQVNDWSEVTLPLLNSFINQNKEYNMEKLTMTYWANRMRNDLNNL